MSRKPSHTRAPLMLLALLAGLAFSACPGGGQQPPDDCVTVGNFRVCVPPVIELEPEYQTVVTSVYEVGETALFKIRVVNNGDGPLFISGASFDYQPPEGADDGATPAFELIPPTVDFQAEPLEIRGKSGTEGLPFFDFDIRFTRPPDALVREAKLTISSNDPENQNIVGTLVTESGVPDLLTDRPMVDFKLVPKGTTVTETVQILNVGSRTLAVSGFRLTDLRFGAKGDGFDIGGGPSADLEVDLPEAILIGKGEQHPIEVTFTSDSPTPAEGDLLIFSDDPDSGAGGYTLRLIANKSGPCILVEPRTVDFGGKMLGGIYPRTVQIRSCGTEPLSISDVVLRDDSSPDFGVDLSDLPSQPSPGTPLQVPINEQVQLDVTFTPDEVNPKDADNIPIPDEGTLVIHSNAFETMVEVPLTGAGAETDKPVAVCDVEEGDEVIPQTVLHLDGRASYAPYGSITTYSWTVEEPEGHQGVFLPSTTADQPTFQANIVGLYTFRLTVWDESGGKSDPTDPADKSVCQVLVQSNEAIHVELTWQTPGDEDPGDTGEGKGSDLDLHFTHPNATGPDLDGDGLPDPWFDEDYDCFWHNTNPNWASFDPAAEDDPRLDRDDTDGIGPENLNLRVPEDGTTYRIGVHYWDDHKYGDSIAMVKVYSYSQLVYEVKDVPLTERDMWCVGYALWENDMLTVDPCGEPGAEEIVPDYVNPFFFQP